MIDLTQQPCPVCGERTSSQLFHKTSYPEHGYPGTFVLRRCERCGLLFNSPRLDDSELGQLYGRNYYFFLRNDSREFSRIVSMYQRTIGLIPSEITDKASLDIGSGRGYFPAVLRELGWRAAGVEISPEASQYSRSSFGLDVFTGTAEQYAASDKAKQYPLVTAIDVIEHVPDPGAFVAALAKLVAPGGRLVIDTPNARAANIQSKGVSWKGFNPFHIYLFSIDNLTQLLERHGLSVTRSFSYGNAPTPIDGRDKLIAKLKSAGLLSTLVSAYFGIKKLTTSRGGDADKHISHAVARINSEPSYEQTSDNAAPLAESKTGDNIVVIATKSA